MDVLTLESDRLDAAARAELRTLWARTFGDRFDDHDADHAYGGVHVVVRDSGRLVGHASAVPRSIRFGRGPWRTVGYVEAVATDPARQGEGIGPVGPPASTSRSAGRGGAGSRTPGPPRASSVTTSTAG